MVIIFKIDGVNSQVSKRFVFRKFDLLKQKSLTNQSHSELLKPHTGFVNLKILDFSFCKLKSAKKIVSEYFLDKTTIIHRTSEKCLNVTNSANIFRAITNWCFDLFRSIESRKFVLILALIFLSIHVQR